MTHLEALTELCRHLGGSVRVTFGAEEEGDQTGDCAVKVSMNRQVARLRRGPDPETCARDICEELADDISVLANVLMLVPDSDEPEETT